jgi:hypothetical protein
VGAGIKLAEGIPLLDKISIPALAAFAGCFVYARRRLSYRNGFGLPEVFLLMFLISPLLTSALNAGPVLSGARLLPGVGPYDALSAIVNQILFVIPFLFGRQLFRNATDIEEVLRALVIAGLLYSFPMLFEIRFSPQLHNWVYGYYPSGFNTEIRYGGFRPTVFLENGLVTTFFVMTAAVAGGAFWRTRTRVRKLAPATVMVYLSAVLVLCKSLGALVYGAVLVPLVRLTMPRLQLRIATILVILAVAYPLLRVTDLVPTKYMLDAAVLANQERADSLEFRFHQERQLLERASQRILFGWGRWGRSRIYDESGKNVSITDGRWIITLGQFGLFGFLAEFGLLGLPVFRAASALRFAESERDRVFLGALALIIAINMIDLLPNASLSPWTWLLSGALLGRAEEMCNAARQQHRDRMAGRRHPTAKANFCGSGGRTQLRAPYASKTDAKYMHATRYLSRSGRSLKW